ncbi:MAG: glycosyltransferase [Pseudomonadota bacterium]
MTDNTPVPTIIIPTWNEADNVPILIERIKLAMAELDWRIIVVDDDSEDKTWQVAEGIAREDTRVSVIRRIGRKGLSSACLEGFAASNTELCAVIDADLQHDEALLPQMTRQFAEQAELDLVVASRKLDNASFGQMPKYRVVASEFARRLSTLALRVPLTDPMSGFFMVRRETLTDMQDKLFGRGFKILLDICAAADRPLLLKELPYNMRARHAGESKLKWRVMFEFAAFLIYQFFGRRFLLPPRFIKFCLVGLSGVIVHMSVLGISHKLLLWSFLYSQIAATLLAMCWNFVLNNSFTFGEQQLDGTAFYKGALSFTIICGIGSFIAVSVSTFLNDHGMIWWLAGFVSVVLAAFWNFCVNNVFTWREQN